MSEESTVAYGVVDMPRGDATGDTWTTVCASEAEAREKARDDWQHLTTSERKRRTICAAVGRLDDDGKFYLGEYTPIEVHEDIYEEGE